jgi:hypothetical protein
MHDPDDTHVHVPFVTEDTEEGGDEDMEMATAAQALRLYEGVWRALVRHVEGQQGIAGSFARELYVLMDAQGTVNLLDTYAAAAGAIARLQHELWTRHGMTQGMASVAATDMVKHMAAGNVASLRAARRVLTGTALPVHTLVLRVSIRSLVHMGSTADKAWFRNTHANGLIVRPHKITIVEPMAPTPLPAIIQALDDVFRPSSTHMEVLATKTKGQAPVANLALCTLCAAVLVLLLLANPALHDTQAHVEQISTWAHRHQHWLLRKLTANITSKAASP